MRSRPASDESALPRGEIRWRGAPSVALLLRLDDGFGLAGVFVGSNKPGLALSAPRALVLGLVFDLGDVMSGAADDDGFAAAPALWPGPRDEPNAESEEVGAAFVLLLPPPLSASLRVAAALRASAPRFPTPSMAAPPHA